MLTVPSGRALMMESLAPYELYRWSEELFEQRDYYGAAEVLEHLLERHPDERDLAQARELLVRSYYHSARLGRAAEAGEAGRSLEATGDVPAGGVRVRVPADASRLRREREGQAGGDPASAVRQASAVRSAASGPPDRHPCRRAGGRLRAEPEAAREQGGLQQLEHELHEGIPSYL